MPGETDLQKILASISPILLPEEYIFATFPNTPYGAHPHLSPLASFQEAEGLTLILPRTQADQHKIPYQTTYRCITLQVHSNLDAVGLTAAIATQLAQHNLSANVLAAYYHDHIFVQSANAQKALKAIQELSN